MEMLLMGACLSMFGLAVACLAFGAATRETRGSAGGAAPPMEKEAVKAAASPARFFVEPPVLPMAARTRVPIEALLLADRKPRPPGTGGRGVLPGIPQRRAAAQPHHLHAGELRMPHGRHRPS